MHQMRYSHFTALSGRPDFDALGIRKLPMLYGQTIFHDDPATGKAGKVLDEARFRAVLSKKYAPPYADWLVLDIEHLPLKGNPENVAVFQDVVALARAAAPSAKLAIYGGGGVGHMHHASVDKADVLSRWRAWHDDTLAPVLALLDGVTINAYTLDATLWHWERVLGRNLEEARRLADKPVLVYLKPRFNIHAPEFKNKPLPYDLVRWQLDYLRANLTERDIALWWDGGQRDWGPDDADGWWRAVEEGWLRPPPPPKGELELCRAETERLGVLAATLSARLTRLEAEVDFADTALIRIRGILRERP